MGDAEPPLKEKIVDYVCKEIISNNLKSKDRIKEQYLAQKFQISRAPVREALLELVSLGILEQKTRKGVFVKEITSKDIYDTYETKGVVEGFLASNFSLYATKQDFAKLQELANSMDSKDRDSIVKIGDKFHKYTLKYAKNRVLLKQLEMINKKSQILFYINWTKLYTAEEVTIRHQKIVDAIKIGKKKIIEETIREHYFETGMKIVLLKEIM